MLNDENFLTSTEAAKLLFISAQTLRRWEAQGVIQSVRTVGSHRRYKLSEVLLLSQSLGNSTPHSSPAGAQQVLQRLHQPLDPNPKRLFSSEDGYALPKGGQFGRGMIPLGMFESGPKQGKAFGMKVDDLDKHLFLGGRTGTGKSEMFKWMAYGCVKADYPVVLLDSHGQLSNDLLDILIVHCPERVKDIVVCDLSDPDHPLAINPLDIRSYEQIETTVHVVLEMLSQQMQLGAGNAPRAFNFAAQAISALCEANLHITDPEAKCTILHIVTFFVDPEFRRLVLEFCSNPTVKENFDPERGLFEQMSEKAQAELAMPITRAIAPIANSPAFATAFAAGENRMDFGNLLNQNKIILFKLARFSQQKKIGELVGTLLLSWIANSVDTFGRGLDPATRVAYGSGCRVFVDEALSFLPARSSLPEMMTLGRKFDVGFVLSHQHLSQSDDKLVDALFANCGSKMCLGMDKESAQRMATALGGHSAQLTADDIAELADYHFYANVLLPAENSGIGPSGAFAARAMPTMHSELNSYHKRVREQVLESSWQLLCNNKEEILEKRQTAIDDIKSILTDLWKERVDILPVREPAIDETVDIWAEPLNDDATEPMNNEKVEWNADFSATMTLALLMFPQVSAIQLKAISAQSESLIAGGIQKDLMSALQQAYIQIIALP